MGEFGRTITGLRRLVSFTLAREPSKYEGRRIAGSAGPQASLFRPSYRRVELCPETPGAVARGLLRQADGESDREVPVSCPARADKVLPRQWHLRAGLGSVRF